MKMEGGSKGKSRKKAEPETISDIEDEDEDEPEANIVDPDEQEEDDDEAEDGLKERYRRALEAEGKGRPSAEDMSFTRYVRNPNRSG